MKRGGYTHCSGCGASTVDPDDIPNTWWKHKECLGKPNAYCAKCGDPKVEVNRNFVHDDCLVRRTA